MTQRSYLGRRLGSTLPRSPASASSRPQKHVPALTGVGELSVAATSGVSGEDRVPQAAQQAAQQPARMTRYTPRAGSRQCSPGLGESTAPRSRLLTYGRTNSRVPCDFDQHADLRFKGSHLSHNNQHQPHVLGARFCVSIPTTPPILQAHMYCPQQRAVAQCHAASLGHSWL